METTEHKNIAITEPHAVLFACKAKQNKKQHKENDAARTEALTVASEAGHVLCNIFLSIHTQAIHSSKLNSIDT